MTIDVPELVPVQDLAHELGLSPLAMRRRLEKLQAKEQRTILFKAAGRSGHWSVDRSYLRRMSGDAGVSTWEKLRSLESELVDARAEISELRAEFVALRQRLNDD